MDRFDIVVIGGGPAGTRAAERAASNDADVIVLEKGVPRADREHLGPDSTDAAGMLDYWVDIMDIPFEEIPDEIVLRELSGTEFIGPQNTCTLYSTGMKASYDGFGFTFHRAKMDDWLRKRAEAAGAQYNVGTQVTSLETDLTGSPRHTITLGSGDELGAEYVICADGPQRTVTLRALDQFLPDDQSAATVIGPRTANHIAYQEYRDFPAELFDPEMLKFWWGYIPGETAYPWVFPNDGTVARVGLTMPMAIDLETVEARESYVLLEADDDTVPSGAVYLERLLQHVYGDAYSVPDDFPLVEDRGKSGGTEAYAISSTRPIDSPTGAGIAVVGGAMGTTSAFHEGGYHVAARTGAIAGELAATDRLSAYNNEWKRVIGDEILRNVSFAELVKDFTPVEWDRAFGIANRMVGDASEDALLRRRLSAGPGAIKALLKYRWVKRRYRNGKYVQLHEDEYTV